MTTLIKLLFSLWPFLKEMILKDKESKQFIEKNRIVLWTSASSLCLFLLFVNAHSNTIRLNRALEQSYAEYEKLEIKYHNMKEKRDVVQQDLTYYRNAFIACKELPVYDMFVGDRPAGAIPGVPDKPPSEQLREKVILGGNRDDVEPDSNDKQTH